MSSPAALPQPSAVPRRDAADLEAGTLALAELIQHCQDGIVSYCRRHVPATLPVHEVVQEIFLVAFESLSRFRGEASMKTWLFGIAAKKCLEVRRHSARRATLMRSHQRHVRDLVHCELPRSPEEVLVQKRQRRQVTHILGRLRAYERTLLGLRYGDECSCEDIARRLRVSKRTVERHIRRAEAQFLKMYGKMYGALAPGRDSNHAA